MSSPGTGMRLAFIEPHLGRVGGIRRMVEFANRLGARGHEVAFVLPDGEYLACRWMTCTAAVIPISEAVDQPWDVVLFNHEPQWYLLDRFTAARRQVFYALHYSRLYGKEGSWESLRVPVDLQLANSAWTADRVADEIGSRPTVQLGGVNREMFRPRGGPKRYTVLCSGVEKDWKGTDTVLFAGRLAGAAVEGYADLDLTQEELGRAYDAAMVFAVGSWFEGFCQPGLEALACGVPLVTTDNGGCLEYATDGETALVVPPRDAPAMAAAFERLLEDDDLGARLSAAGLDVVADRFDWEQRTSELAERFDGVVAAPAAVPATAGLSRDTPAEPTLSVVVLAWDNLLFTQRFVESVRQHTAVPYELVIVDNGSEPEAASYARHAGDVTVLNDQNLGFARGMNQGLEACSGEWVAFCNNDTVLPDGWAESLLEAAARHPEAGIIVPALTEARNPITVRTEPGTEVVPLPPFSAPPAAVLYLMRADVARELAGWGEEYEVASGEDVDLAFKVWVNDLDIVYDERVLVDHVGKGSASKLEDWEGLWARNRQRFLDKWQSDEAVPRLAVCDPDRHARNRRVAQATAGWMQRFFAARERGGAPAGPPTSVHRTGGESWLHRLAQIDLGDDRPFLVRGPSGLAYLVEGRTRREVRSGLLARALEDVYGDLGEAEEEVIAPLDEGPPVELLEVRGDVPFVVVGGRRHRVVGIPLPHPVDDEFTSELEDGAELDLSRLEPPVEESADAVSLVGQRRAREAAAAAPDLLSADAARIVRDADGSMFVIEGAVRRPIRSGLLARALERALGAAGVLTPEDRRLPAGPAVEVYEELDSPPFVVVGGRRHVVRGLPLPAAVETGRFDRSPEGETLDVARVERAVVAPWTLGRLARAVRRRLPGG